MNRISKHLSHKLAVITACALTLSAMLTGCMPFKELKEESIVEGMGIDYTPNGYHVTFQIYKPEGGGDSSKKSKSKVTILETDGGSLFDAVRNATLQNGRKLYFSNTRAYVIGEEACKKDFGKLLDFMERNQQIRPSDHLYIAKGKASDILTYSKNEEIVPAVNLEQMSEDSVQTSKTPDVQLFDIFKCTSSELTDPVIPAVSLKEGNGGEKKLEMDGTAVFHKSQFMGYLDGKETRGLLWMNSKVHGGVLLLSIPQGGVASMEILKGGSKVTIKGDEKSPSYQVEIKVNSNLVELQSQKDYTIDGSFVSKLKKIQDDTIKSEAQAAVDKALKTYGTDVFGFGLKTFQEKPDVWHKLSKEWDKKAKDIKVEIKVDSKINHIGLTNQTA